MHSEGYGFGNHMGDLTYYQRDFLIFMKNEINERQKDTNFGGESFSNTKKEVSGMWNEIDED